MYLSKNIIPAVASILIATSSYGQVPAPAVQLSKMYGGTDSDYPTSIIETKDNGFLIGGWVMSKDGDVVGAHGNGNITDGWVIKTDSAGTLLWSRALGGSDFDDVHTVAEGRNAYVVGGRFWSYDGDASGTTGPLSRGFIAWLDKTDGSILSIKTYAGTHLGHVQDIKVVNDNNLLVSGTKYTTSLSHGTLWVTLMDSTGNPIWEKNYGRATVMSGAESACSSIKDGDYYMVAGVTTSSDGDAVGQHGAGDGFVLRLDSEGNKIWSKCYGGTGDDYVQWITKSGDGYILGGTTPSPDGGDIQGQHGMFDYWVYKIDTAGNILWSKVLGGSNTERMYGMSGTCDGGVIVSGTAQSNDGDVTLTQGIIDFFIVRISADGDIEWNKCYGSSTTEAYCVVTTTRDSGYAISGIVSGSDGDIGGVIEQGMGDIWLGKLSPDGLNNTCPEIEEPASTTSIATNDEISIFPNPANDHIIIDTHIKQNTNATISDITGRKISTHTLGPDKKTIISTANLVPGVYYVQIEGIERQAVHKVHIIH